MFRILVSLEIYKIRQVSVKSSSSSYWRLRVRSFRCPETATKAPSRWRSTKRIRIVESFDDSARQFTRYRCDICVFSFSKTVAAECGEAGGHQLRQLQDRDHHALAEEPGRRASLQRVRPLLQATQRK